MVKQSFSWAKKRSSGDSIIEVLIAVAVFSAIAVAALAIMNRGLEGAQSSLETTIARTEIDAQAEKIRFIADSVSSNPEIYRGKWNNMINGTVDGVAIKALPTNSNDYKSFMDNYKTKEQLDRCSGVINGYNAFVLDENNDVIPRGPNNAESTAIPSVSTGGLFVVAVEGKTNNNGTSSDTSDDFVEYYDFYINTCWNEPGSSFPTKLSTTIRIQNPDFTFSEYTEGPEGYNKGQVKVVYHWVKIGDPSPDFKNNDGGNWLNAPDGSTSHKESDKTATVTYTGLDSDIASAGEISTIRLLNANSKYNEYKFTGFVYGNTNVAATGGLPAVNCWLPSMVDGATYQCEWANSPNYDKRKERLDDGTEISIIDIYATWEFSPDPKYLWCINYNKSGLPSDGGSITNDLHTGTLKTSGEGWYTKKVYCKETATASGADLTLSTTGYTAEKTVGSNKYENYKAYGWRTGGAGTWGNLSSYYTTNATTRIIALGASANDRKITVNTSSTHDTGNSLGIATATFNRYNNSGGGVYYVNIYPQWRANLRIQSDTQRCAKVKESGWEFLNFSGDYKDSSCTDTSFGTKYYAKKWNCADLGLSCTITAELHSYNNSYEVTVEHDLWFDTKKTVYKYLDAHTYVGRDVSYSQSYVSNPNYAFKLLDTSNLNVRNINLQWYDVFDWVKDGNYETKKIFEWSSGNYGTTTVINPGTSTTNVHYSVFADYDSNADGRSNIKSGDSVRVNYMLADGTTGYRDLTAGSSVDARCWHVFKFVPSEGKLLIENTFYNKDKNNTNTITVNTCANPTNSQSPTWAQTIPF